LIEEEVVEGAGNPDPYCKNVLLEGIKATEEAESSVE
jgi:hypothetical protein